MWIQSGTPALVLAPMEGVTDAPMRAFLTERGGFDYCVSEFIRISHELLPDKVYYRYLPELSTAGLTPSRVPVQVQLLGGDPERLALSAVQAVKLGALAVDINFGCPAPTVNRHDGGATLLKHPDRIFKIISTIRKELPATIPLSAKVRLGWDNTEAIFENSQAIQDAGASWITIHGRTKTQGYAPPVHWDVIGKAREKLHLPVVANGDITSLEDFRRCRNETGAEHFMIGRGALSNLSLPFQIREEWGAEQIPLPFYDDKEKWLKALKHFSLYAEPFGAMPGYTTRRIKQWLNLANKHHPLPWFEKVKRSQSLSEIWAALQD